MREDHAEGLFWDIAHPLIGHLGWWLRWTNNKRTAGYCRVLRMEVQLSRVIVELNDERHVTALICHELAHATASCRHNEVWRREARWIGEQHGGEEVGELAAMRELPLVLPKGPVTYHCTACGLVSYGYRKPKRGRRRGRGHRHGHGHGRVLYCKACRMIQGVWSELEIEIS